MRIFKKHHFFTKHLAETDSALTLLMILTTKYMIKVGNCTAQNVTLFDQIRRKLRIWSHLQKKSLMENFIFCAVSK